MPPQRLTRGKLLAPGLIMDGGVAYKAKRIRITATPPGTEVDTGFDLPAKAIVLDVYLDVTTVEATGTTKTLDVGTLTGETGGDPDGFLDGVSVATPAGLRRGSLAPTATLGVLLKELSTGGTVHVPKAYLSDSLVAKSVSYTAGSANFAEFRGSIVIVYLDLNP